MFPPDLYTFLDYKGQFNYNTVLTQWLLGVSYNGHLINIMRAYF